MGKVRVQINWADGQSVERLFDAETLVIGSGPEAQFQVTRAPEVAPAHLLVMPRANGCWVAASREATVPPMYAGKKFDNGVVPWGAEIDIGSVTVRIMKPTAGGQSSGLRMVLMASVAAVVCYLLLAEDSEELPRATAPPPQLFEAIS